MLEGLVFVLCAAVMVGALIGFGVSLFDPTSDDTPWWLDFLGGFVLGFVGVLALAMFCVAVYFFAVGIVDFVG